MNCGASVGSERRLEGSQFVPQSPPAPSACGQRSSLQYSWANGAMLASKSWRRSLCSSRCGSFSHRLRDGSETLSGLPGRPVSQHESCWRKSPDATAVAQGSNPPDPATLREGCCHCDRLGVRVPLTLHTLDWLRTRSSLHSSGVSGPPTAAVRHPESRSGA